MFVHEIIANKTAQILASAEMDEQQVWHRVNVNIRDEEGKELITDEQKGTAFFQRYFKQTD